MNDFTYYSPTEFFFGRGVTDQVGQKLAARGYKHALVVYGKGSVVRTGTLDRVKASLAEAGIKVEELAGVRPNPEVGLVREGVELARARRVDCILAVGGGSTIDCAKAVAFGTPPTATCGISFPRKPRSARRCPWRACSLSPRRDPKVPTRA